MAAAAAVEGQREAELAARASARGRGGAGGTSGSPDGQAGASGSAGGNNGGGGGGGGFNGTDSAIPLANTGLITGGNGGSGGNGAQSTGVSGGGGGGAGGYGAVVSSGGTSVNSGSITGGTGGKGGTGKSRLLHLRRQRQRRRRRRGPAVHHPGRYLQEHRRDAGHGRRHRGKRRCGGDDFGIGPGSPGLGGQGIVGSDLTVVTNGSISGGLAGDGVNTIQRHHLQRWGQYFLSFSPVMGSRETSSPTARWISFGSAGPTPRRSTSTTLPRDKRSRTSATSKRPAPALGHSSERGPTPVPRTIQAGRLAINGSTNSDTTVDATGELGGTGTINGDLINNGIVAAGNSIGTLNVNGNFTHGANATMQVEIDAAGHSDLVDVTGTSTINGGHVQVLAAPGVYISGQQFIAIRN